MDTDPPPAVTLNVPFPPTVIDTIVARLAERAERSQPAAVERWVGVADVAAHLGCKRQRIYDLYRRKCNGIPHRKEGGRLLFRLSEIDRWIESGHAA
ncbi:MAG: helix-turn-helix domain-containing protein [Thermoleophilaceae bacterium]